MLTNDEFINLIFKYERFNKNEITNIYNDVNAIISSVKQIQRNLSDKLYETLNSDDINDNSNEIFEDIQLIKKQVKDLKLLSYKLNQENSILYKLQECKPVKLYITLNDICPVCNIKMNATKTTYSNLSNNNEIEYKKLETYYCHNCKKYFLDDDNIELINAKKTNLILLFEYYKKLSMFDVIVITHINKCSGQNHEIKDMNGIIPIINTVGSIEYITVNIIYCKTCNRYIMLKSEYDSIKGIPICEIHDETQQTDNKSQQNIYNGRGSKLCNYGYNVNYIHNLSDKTRHTILSVHLLSNSMTKGEICSYLDSQIIKGSKIPSWKIAVSKWKSDKEFVLNFDSEKMKSTININKLILKYKVKE